MTPAPTNFDVMAYEERIAQMSRQKIPAREKVRRLGLAEDRQSEPVVGLILWDEDNAKKGPKL